MMIWNHERCRRYSVIAIVARRADEVNCECVQNIDMTEQELTVMLCAVSRFQATAMPTATGKTEFHLAQQGWALVVTNLRVERGIRNSTWMHGVSEV